MLRIVSLFLILSGSMIGSAFAFLPKSFEAQIEQEQKSSLTSTVRKSQGTMIYRYPGQMRFEIKGVDDVVFVTNGKKTWYYTGPFVEDEPGELTISDDGPNVMTKFFDSFSKGLISNELYQVEKKGSKADISFSKEMTNDLGVKSSTFHFKGNSFDFKELHKIDLVQEDGRLVSITLRNMKVDSQPDSSKFNFVPPPNTKIKN